MKSLLQRIACALVLAMLPFTSFADAYPTKPIRLIVPFPPGGANDNLARIIGRKVSDHLGQQVVIDNRPGAGITIGTGIAAKSPADGYNILIVNSIMHSASPSLYKNLPYDPVTDFVPIAPLAIGSYVLVVVDKFPARNFAEFMDLVRAKPGTYNYSSSGIGSTPHLIAELFKRQTSVKVTHVPYKGGGPSVVGLLAGDVAFTFESVSTVAGNIKSGQMRALAVTTPTRVPSLPDVPTLQELGITGFDVSAMYGLVAPKGTPAEAVDRLGKEVALALQDPEVKEAFLAQGAVATALPAQALGDRLKLEVGNWSRVVKEIGIRAE